MQTKRKLDKEHAHIMFVTPSMNYGGAERVMSILMNELINNGFKISLVCLNDTPVVVYQLSPLIEIHYLKGVRFNKVKAFLSPIHQLRRVMKVLRPDVIVSFFNNTSCFSWLAQLGLNIPIIFSERNDPTHNIKGLNARFFQKWALTISNKIVFQTQGAKSLYKSRSIQNKSVVIYNPLNISNKSANVSEKCYKLVSVGRLSSQKNQKVLIDAIARISSSYPDLTLTIFGEGNLRTNLEQQIKNLGLTGKVLLPGNESNVIDKIIDYRLFVFSSDYEGIPNALLEAMSIGLPCVSTDCSPGGAKEFINNYENGILVPCNDAEAMSNAIEFHLQNPEKSLLMGKNAISISKLLDVGVIVKKWMSLFDSIEIK